MILYNIKKSLKSGDGDGLYLEIFLEAFRSVMSKEGHFLFNDALNTFYLRLYGLGHMVHDHSDSERENLLPPHGLLFPINSNGSFICTIPQTGWHIPRPLLNQSWSIGWNEKTLNGSTR